MVAGSESAVRRALDRLALEGRSRTLRESSRDGRRSGRAGARVLVRRGRGRRGDPPAAMHGWPLPPAMTGLARVAVIGDFHPPGLNVASTLSYADPARAGAGADGLRQLAAFVTVAGNIGAGPKIQNLSIAADGTNVGWSFRARRRGDAAVPGVAAQDVRRRHTPARLTA